MSFVKSICNNTVYSFLTTHDDSNGIEVEDINELMQNDMSLQVEQILFQNNAEIKAEDSNFTASSNSCSSDKNQMPSSVSSIDINSSSSSINTNMHNSNTIADFRIIKSPKKKKVTKRKEKTSSICIQNYVQQTFDDTSNTSDSTIKKQKNGSKQLPEEAISVMKTWYDAHIENPYPNDADRKEMAILGNIKENQVKAWFANRRNRTSNTRSKKVRKSSCSKNSKTFQQTETPLHSITNTNTLERFDSMLSAEIETKATKMKSSRIVQNHKLHESTNFCINSQILPSISDINFNLVSPSSVSSNPSSSPNDQIQQQYDDDWWLNPLMDNSFQDQNCEGLDQFILSIQDQQQQQQCTIPTTTQETKIQHSDEEVLNQSFSYINNLNLESISSECNTPPLILPYYHSSSSDVDKMISTESQQFPNQVINETDFNKNLDNENFQYDLNNQIKRQDNLNLSFIGQNSLDYNNNSLFHSNNDKIIANEESQPFLAQSISPNYFNKNLISNCEYDFNQIKIENNSNLNLIQPDFLSNHNDNYDYHSSYGFNNGGQFFNMNFEQQQINFNETTYVPSLIQHQKHAHHMNNEQLLQSPFLKRHQLSPINNNTSNDVHMNDYQSHMYCNSLNQNQFQDIDYSSYVSINDANNMDYFWPHNDKLNEQKEYEHQLATLDASSLREVQNQQLTSTNEPSLQHRAFIQQHSLFNDNQSDNNIFNSSFSNENIFINSHQQNENFTNDRLEKWSINSHPKLASTLLNNKATKPISRRNNKNNNTYQ